MAYPIAFHVAAIAPSVSDSSSPKLRSSLFKSPNASKFDKRPITSTWLANSFNVKTEINIGQPTRVLVNRQIVCMGAGRARKVPVSPLELENATRPPTNLYTAEAPHTATILSVDKISGPKAPAEYYNIVFDHAGFLPHWEGQVFGAIPPGENPFEPVVDAKPSYFSGASSRYGDYFNNQTATLCVRLVSGTISQRLCESKPGDKFQFTGPLREAMLLGSYDPNATHIFVATGTGVAPFRAHLRRFFKEYIPTFTFSGLAWLFHGVANRDSQLYAEEFEQYQADYPNNFRYTTALSRELQRKYVQDVFAEYAGQVLDLLVKGAYIYFAGRKDMVEPIEQALADAASQSGQNWATILESLKRNNQWRVEVY